MKEGSVCISDKSMTLKDDTEVGAFGPIARDRKINNLRAYPFIIDLTSIEKKVYFSFLSEF